MAIIDLIQSQLSPEFISQAATQLGESESKVSKAIGCFIPTVLGGLANNTENDSMMQTLANPESKNLLGNLLDQAKENQEGNPFISSLFGDRAPELLQIVSQYTGIQNSSAQSLLGTVTHAAIGLVSKHAQENNLDTSGIASLLSQQKGVLSSMVPAGLSLGSFGLDEAMSSAKEKVTSAFSQSAETVSNVSHTINPLNSSPDPGKGSFWKWLLPLLLLGLAIWFLWKQYHTNEENEKNTTSKDSILVSKVAVGSANINKTTTELILPSGQKISAYKGGIEEQLVQFLQSEDYKNATEEDLKTKWFNFDNINFEFGTTTLTKDSQNQLRNLKAICKEFPNAKFKIGAYTDKVGDEKTNELLSQKRADAIKDAIASPQVTEAKGFGEQFAKIDEKASDEERAIDRKTAIRLTK